MDYGKYVDETLASIDIVKAAAERAVESGDFVELVRLMTNLRTLEYSLVSDTRKLRWSQRSKEIA